MVVEHSKMICSNEAVTTQEIRHTASLDNEIIDVEFLKFDSSLFAENVDEPTEDLEVPETNYTFGTLIRAQALGDYQALKKLGRRVLRINLKKDVAGNLSQLSKLIHDNLRS